MRYTLGHRNKHEVMPSVGELMSFEKRLGLLSIDVYEKFATNVGAVKRDLIDLLDKLRSEGKQVVAYGATSKSTTVTNFFGVTPNHIEFICDTTPTKHFKYSPGAHIPVVPHSRFKNSSPDYVLLFAWNHAEEIMRKEKSFMESIGAKWILYVPSVSILSP